MATGEDIRYVGTEMEWLVEVQDSPEEPFQQLSAARAHAVVENHRPKGMLMVGTFTSNGARFYVDVGWHPEYATPECTLDEIVAVEIAGEEVVYESLMHARDRGLFYDFILNKRTVDDKNNTWGYHESFSAPAAHMAIDAEHLAFSGLHIATGNILAGAGAVVIDNDGRPRFRIAQKILNLNCDFAQSSHLKDQPLISLRDEPHANKNDTLRIHLTSYDANMSPWATWWRTGSAIAVQRLVEHGDYGEDLMPEWPLHVLAKYVAADPSLQHRFHLARPLRGRITKMSAVEMQEEILDRASRLDLPDNERKVRLAWEKALADARENPRLLMDRVEWIGKRLALAHYMAVHEVGIDDPEVHARDIKWADMDPEHGIAQRLRASAKAYGRHMPPRKAIEEYKEHAPKSSRATLREWGIREACKAKNPAAARANWEVVLFPDGRRLDLTNIGRTALLPQGLAKK